jgi:hypothetical protein
MHLYQNTTKRLKTPKNPITIDFHIVKSWFCNKTTHRVYTYWQTKCCTATTPRVYPYWLLKVLFPGRIRVYPNWQIWIAPKWWIYIGVNPKHQNALQSTNTYALMHLYQNSKKRLYAPINALKIDYGFMLFHLTPNPLGYTLIGFVPIWKVIVT